jgi:hypothetical protein
LWPMALTRETTCLNERKSDLVMVILLLGTL